MNQGETTVYQYFDRRGRLLYVGVTSRATRRMDEHASTKSWWRDAVACTVEHFATRAEALAREAYLIAIYQPPYNTQGKKRQSVVRITSPWQDGSGPATWRCSRCNEARADESGLCGRCRSHLAGSGREPTAIPEPRTGQSCTDCGETASLSKVRRLCRSCEGKRARMAAKEIAS